MTPTVLDRLDAHPGNRVPTLGTPWWDEVGRSLTTQPPAWLAAVDTPGPLTVDRAWVLLGWAETAATVVRRAGGRETLTAAVQVLALLDDGPLDRRDVMVVGPLLRRAAEARRLDWSSAVAAGTARAGTHGPTAAVWLERVQPRIPATHEEISTGLAAPRFVRLGTNEEAVARAVEAAGPRRRWPWRRG